MDKNRSSLENLKSLEVFMEIRERRLFAEIKDEVEYYTGKEELAKRECEEYVFQLTKEAEEERKRLNRVSELSLKIKELTSQKSLSSKTGQFGVAQGPEYKRAIGELEEIARVLSTQEVRARASELCSYLTSIVKKVVGKSEEESIIRQCTELQAFCAKDSVEKELSGKISLREAERDQRIKQINDNVCGTIEQSVELYVGNLRLEILGERYANGEPPRVRTTK